MGGVDAESGETIPARQGAERGVIGCAMQYQGSFCFVRGMILRPIYIPMGITKSGEAKYVKEKNS